MVEYQERSIGIGRNVQFTLRVNDMGVRHLPVHSKHETTRAYSAIAFILAIFLLAFRDIKWNAQTITILTFLVGAVILCLWIVLEITGWNKISRYLTERLLYKTRLMKRRPSPPPEANVIKRTIPEKVKDAAQAIHENVKSVTRKYVLKRIMTAVRVMQRFRLGRRDAVTVGPSRPNADLEHGSQSQESAGPSAQNLSLVEGSRGDSLRQSTGNRADTNEIPMNEMGPASGGDQSLIL